VLLSERIAKLEARVAELERELYWHRRTSDQIFDLIRQAAALEVEAHQRVFKTQ
jgi:hypothetical protein